MRAINKGCSLAGLMFFLGIFIMVGIGLALWGLNVLEQSRVSENWPSTNGEVVTSEVREERDEDGTTYYGDVTFQYVINDRRYTADTVSFGQYGGSRKHAAEIVSRYRPGARVPVYYDPEAPQTAVLEPGVTWSSYLLLVMGLMFAGLPIVIGLVAFVSAVRGR